MVHGTMLEAAELERAREYSRTKDRLALLGMSASLLTSAGFLFTGLAARVNRALLPERDASLPQRLVYGVVLSLASTLAGLPLAYYSGYAIEHRYELSKQTRAAWLPRSNRSRFMTLFQAATKSRANFSLASADAYTSASARSWECEPNTRSTAVAVHLTLPCASRPS